MIPSYRITCLILMSFFYLGTLLSQDAPHYYKNKDLPCLDKKFTISYHWVFDSVPNAPINDMSIQASIAKLNEAFSPICVSFEICKKDEIPWYQFDTINAIQEFKELDDRVHNNFHINLYLVTGSTIGRCGYAERDSLKRELGARIMIEKACFSPGINALPHLIGSLFGLYTTSETSNGVELVNGSNCATAGDKICDTPADPAYNVPTFYCVLPNNIKDKNGEYYAPDISNYMSTYFGCHCKFTRDQYIFMANNYLTMIKKPW